MSVDIPLAVCVINGYPAPNRQVLAEAGVSQAHELYVNFLNRYTPMAQIDILYVADLDVGLPSGAALDSYDAFIWTGSNLTIYHDRPEVARQIELCRAIFRAGVPQYGSCWGVQMAAVAGGGEVRKNPRGREWCLARDIALTEEGRAHPLYQGKPARFDGFIMHLDEVTRVPEGGRLLAGNRHTPVQALDVHGPNGGSFWATQYHPEYNLYEMARLLIARRKPLAEEGFFPDEQAVLDYAEQLTRLYRDPGNTDLQEQLKVGPDVLTEEIRECELRNWIDYLVLPHKVTEGSGHAA
jgi:GMP synthase (glutamine-hydrolysing)